MRPLACLLLVLLAAIFALNAEEQLPARVGPDSMEIEPPLLIKEPLNVAEPASNSPPHAMEAVGIAQLESDVARASRNAAAAPRLYKAGIISREEMELRSLKVTRAVAALQKARLDECTRQAAFAQERLARGEAKSDDVTSAEAALAAAATRAQAAITLNERSELEAATIRLQRRKKLHALGAATRSEVERAEESLAALRNKPL